MSSTRVLLCCAVLYIDARREKKKNLYRMAIGEWSVWSIVRYRKILGKVDGKQEDKVQAR